MMRFRLFVFVLSILTSVKAVCQGQDEFEQIGVTLNVQHIGSLEIKAIVHGEIVYLPVIAVFDFLKIRNKPSLNLDSIEGNISGPDVNYLIDQVNNRILYKNREYILKQGGLIRTESDLYLESAYFGEVYGLPCSFNFRSFTISMAVTIDLPAIVEIRQANMRQNLKNLKGEKKADTIIGITPVVIDWGMADWSFMTSQVSKGRGNAKFNLDLGGVVANGQTNFSLEYDTNLPFVFQQQHYNWHHVNNDRTLIRQVTIGEIHPQAISSLYGSVTGIHLTNKPTVYSRSFGVYKVADYTQPGWVVELYVNNVLIKYVKADESGLYKFDVPLIYGSSVVRLLFYGPWGKEHISEKELIIPFNFLPKHGMEYSLSSGIVNDGKGSIFSRFDMNYGTGRHLTLGGGLEYVSSARSDKFIPFINTTVQASPAIMLTAEYIYGIRLKGIAISRLPYRSQLEMQFIRFNRSQSVIKSDLIEEHKAVLSVPIMNRRFDMFSRLTFNQMIYSNQQKSSMELLVSGVFSGVSINAATNALFSGPAYSYLRSNLGLTFSLPAGLKLSPQAEYIFKEKKPSSLKLEAEKKCFRSGYFNFSYGKDILKNSDNFSMGLRIDFSFAQTSFSVQKNNRSLTTVQSAKGGLLFHKKSKYLGLSARSNVGKGGIILVSFLDLNCNGYREDGEPRIAGLNIRINGGRIEYNKKDTSIRIVGLEANTNYFIELDGNSFDHIAWQMRKHYLGVTVEANRLKTVEVPVAVVGEVSGSVYLVDNNEHKPMSRLWVCIYGNDSILIARTLTESDGFFSYSGLAPGSFTASVDQEQLHKLGMNSSRVLSFSILPKQDGDVVDGLEFTLEHSANKNADQ